MKREPKVKAKPGELRVAWGRDEDGEGPDIVYANGEGCPRSSVRLLHFYMGVQRPAGAGCESEFLPSLFDELGRRGYDLTTLKFSIQKKAEAQP